MKKLTRVIDCKKRVGASLLALSITLLVAGTAQAALNCTSCHGNNVDDSHPVDLPYTALATDRDPATGAVKGNHNSHFGKDTDGTVCTRCHGSTAGATKLYLSNHAILSNYSIRMNPAVNYKKAGVATNSFFQTDTPVLGSCNMVACHFQSVNNGGATPVWGAQSFASLKTANNDVNGTCTSCHNGTTLTTGAHQKHITKFGGTLTSCAKCHPDNYSMASQAAFLHATSSSANIAFYFTAAPNNGTGTITGLRSAPNFLPSYATASTATCNSLYCHSSGQGDTAAAATPAYQATAPKWNDTAVACSYCHTTTTRTTGSHTSHITTNAIDCSSCHTGATSTAYNNATHVNGKVDVNSAFTYAKQVSAGDGYSSCSATVCHGSGSTPVWGDTVSAGNNSCTKCHGTGTVTVTDSNRHVVAPSDAAGVGTSLVSTVPKTGAHQTHLVYTNGLSSQGATETDRCTYCHTIPAAATHANSDSTPVFSGLAKPTVASGTYATTYNYNAGSPTCSVYCHNPAAVTGGTLASANAGTGIAPVWTNAAYIADGTLKTEANCNRCHKSPGAVAGTITIVGGNHAAMTITNDCSGCHGHNGGTGGTAGKQHMDGILYGAGACNSCHGYEVGSWAAAPEIDTVNHEGKGAHEKHVTYLTTKRFTVTLTPASDSYASAATTWTNVCGICHGSTPANHQNASVNVTVSSSYLFGTGSTLYSGIPGTSSAANPKTCSNISCHYFTTPLWSTY